MTGDGGAMTLRFWGVRGTLPTPGAATVRYGGNTLCVELRCGPLLPNLQAEFRAHTAFRDFAPGEELRLHPGLRVATTALRHPGNAIGYRIEWGGVSLCYITDTEHPPDGPDPNLRGFVAGTDVMIYDATYTETEYPSRAGWGHSTWRAGADLADAAAVGCLVLFHHDPDHDDSAMDAIASAVAERRPGSLVAKEGMQLEVGSPP